MTGQPPLDNAFSTSLHIQHITKLQSELSPPKLTPGKVEIWGREIQFMSQLVNSCEKFLRSMQKVWLDVKVKYNYGTNRKELKREVKQITHNYNQVQEIYTKIADETAKTPLNEKQKHEQSLAVIQLNEELNKQLTLLENILANSHLSQIKETSLKTSTEVFKHSLESSHQVITKTIADTVSLLTEEEKQRLSELAKQSDFQLTSNILEKAHSSAQNLHKTKEKELSAPHGMDSDPLAPPSKSVILPIYDSPPSQDAVTLADDADIEEGAIADEDSFSDDILQGENETSGDVLQDHEPEALADPLQESVSIEEASLAPPTPSQPEPVTAANDGEVNKQKKRFQTAFNHLTSAKFSDKKAENLVRNMLKIIARHPEVANLPLENGKLPLDAALAIEQKQLSDGLLAHGATSIRAHLQRAFDMLASAKFKARENTLVNEILEILKYNPELATQPLTGPLTGGKQPLHIAILTKNKLLTEKLLEMGTGRAAFTAAVQTEDGKLVRKVFEALMNSTYALLKKEDLQGKVQAEVERIKASQEKFHAETPQYEAMVAAIQANDFDAFIQLIENGAPFLRLNDEGQSLLQLAAIHGNKEAAAYLIRLKRIDPKRADRSGLSFDDYAKDWEQGWLEPYTAKVSSKILTRAIEKGNTKAFVEHVIDGASLLSLNEQGQTMLHLAAVHKNKRIAWFLILQRFPPTFRDNEGKNFFDLAKEFGWTEFLEHPEDPQALNKLEDEFRAIREIEAAYRNRGVKAVEEPALKTSDQFKAYVAAIESGQLATDYTDEQGRSLLHVATLLNDTPLTAYLMQKYAEKDPEMPSTTPEGTPLARTSLHPALNPWTANTPPGGNGFSETPISCALRTGDFQAACLMITEGNTRKNFHFKVTDQPVQDALDCARKFAHMVDPLYVREGEKNQAYAALAWLLVSQVASPFLGAHTEAALWWGSAASVAVSVGLALSRRNTIFEEQLVTPAPSTLPDAIKTAYPHISRWSMGEMLTNATFTPARILSGAIDSWASVNKTFADLGQIYTAGLNRPKQAAYKAGVSLLSAGKTVYYFGNLVQSRIQLLSSLVYPPPPPEEPTCPAVDLLDWVNNPKEIPSAAELRASPEAAEIIVAQLAKNTARFETESDITKAIKRALLSAHPDKGGSNELAELVYRAKDILLDQLKNGPPPLAETAVPSWDYTAPVTQTAKSLEAAWALMLAADQLNMDEGFLQLPAMFFSMAANYFNADYQPPTPNQAEFLELGE